MAKTSSTFGYAPSSRRPATFGYGLVAALSGAKLRIRATDGYSKTSAWSTSSAFTVSENAYPSATLLDLIDGGYVAGNTPYLTFAVSDPDFDPCHMEIQLSLRPDFSSGYYLRSADDQTGWEEAASPFTTWAALDAAGAEAGNRIRYQCPALRYDSYFLRYRAFDGILYSDWSTAISFRVTPSGAAPLVCTIGTETYKIEHLSVTERTGGEGSPFSFDIRLSEYRAKPFARGASVSIGLSPPGTTLSRVWNGTVETSPATGAYVRVNCVMDDAALARELVPVNAASADVGATLAGWVGTYSTTLGNTYMDTTLGVTAALKGQYKSLFDHLREWAQLLGLILYVDSDGEVHLAAPADLPDPVRILHEGYE